MIKVASYCRVSTNKEDQANSFETQQRYFREYIERYPDWELYQVYADEGISGTSTKRRSQFKQMMRDAHEGKFHLVITKEVSRFSRNVLDTIAYTRELKAIGVAVLFVTDHINTMDPDAELRLSIMASLAQEESRRTSGRVVWGQTRQMEKGVVFGSSMLGYDVKNGKITVEPEGAEIVRLIFQKYAIEQMGTTQIAGFLTKEAYHTYKGGTKWRPNTVVRILRNEKYAGDLVQKKSYTPDFLTHEKRKNTGEVPLIRIENHHEAIISREVWNLAQEQLRKNDRHKAASQGHSVRYVFSGKIRCGECGANFVARYKYPGDGIRIRRWGCGTVIREGAASCGVGKLVRDDDAFHMLKTAVQSLEIDTAAIVGNVTALALTAIGTGQTNTAEDPQQLRHQIRQAQWKKEKVLDSYFSGDITRQDMESMKHKYERQLKNLGDKLKKIQEQERRVIDTGLLKSALQTEIASILRCDVESEIFYKHILDGVTVFKDHRLELRLKYLPHVFRFTG